MQEAAETLEEIVKDMATVAVEENDEPVNVTTKVVLEPYDPEYFSNLPSLEEISGNRWRRFPATMLPAPLKPGLPSGHLLRLPPKVQPD